MKGKKKYIFLTMIIILLFLFLVGGAVFLRKSDDKEGGEDEVEPEPEQVEKVIEDPEENKKDGEKNRLLEFVDFELLEGYFMPSQIEKLQDEILQFLSEDSAYDPITKVVCKDIVTEQLKTIEFYCVLDEESGSVLRIVYTKSSAKFEIIHEMISKEILDQERQGTTKQFVETQLPENNPEDEKKLPRQWDYVEEDNTEITLQKKELLEEKIPHEKLELLDSELLMFLKENQEFRREIEIQEVSIEESDSEVCFWGMFCTPRVDGKELFVVYDKSEGYFQFSIQEEGT